MQIIQFSTSSSTFWDQWTKANAHYLWRRRMSQLSPSKLDCCFRWVIEKDRHSKEQILALHMSSWAERRVCCVFRNVHPSLSTQSVASHFLCYVSRVHKAILVRIHTILVILFPFSILKILGMHLRLVLFHHFRWCAALKRAYGEGNRFFLPTAPCTTFQTVNEQTCSTHCSKSSSQHKCCDQRVPGFHRPRVCQHIYESKKAKLSNKSLVVEHFPRQTLQKAFLGWHTVHIVQCCRFQFSLPLLQCVNLSALLSGRAAGE